MQSDEWCCILLRLLHPKEATLKCRRATTSSRRWLIHWFPCANNSSIWLVCHAYLTPSWANDSWVDDMTHWTMTAQYPGYKDLPLWTTHLMQCDWQTMEVNEGHAWSLQHRRSNCHSGSLHWLIKQRFRVFLQLQRLWMDTEVDWLEPYQRQVLLWSSGASQFFHWRRYLCVPP